jgi:hypothetical protein
MWRKILASLLLAAIVQSQLTAMSGGQTQPETHTQAKVEVSPAIGSGTQTVPRGKAAWPRPTASAHQRFDKLRRGREEEVVMLLCRSAGLHPYCPPFKLNQEWLVPVSLELKPVEGFIVRFQQGKNFLPTQQGSAIRTPKGLAFRMKIRAAKDAALGAHKVEGKLTFRSAGVDGIWETRQMDVVIPITVAEHDDRVFRYDWSMNGNTDRPVRKALLAIVAAPIVIPIFLLWLAACELDSDKCAKD